LFSLPDLARMEVEASLHETICRRIKVGMRAVARVSTLPGKELHGRVVEIGQVLVPKPKLLDRTIRQNLALIRLDESTAELRFIRK
jgi:multidrug resistance efflux pump